MKPELKEDIVRLSLGIVCLLLFGFAMIAVRKLLPYLVNLFGA